MTKFSDKIKKAFAEFPDDDGTGVWDVLISNMLREGSSWDDVFHSLVSTKLAGPFLHAQWALYASAALMADEDYDERVTEFLKQTVWKGREAMSELIAESIDNRMDNIRERQRWDKSMRDLCSGAEEMKQAIEDPEFNSSVISLVDMRVWIKQGKPKFPAKHVFEKGKCRYCRVEYDDSDDGLNFLFCEFY